ADEVAQTIQHYYVLETNHPEQHWKPFVDLQKSDGAATEQVELFDADLAQDFYTSGTESQQKGVMLSHTRVISEDGSQMVDGNISEKDVLIHALPFYQSIQLHVF